MDNFLKLYTTDGENLGETPWEVYPRPLCKRNSFLCLNGEWDFTVTDGEEPQNYDRKIIVPFCPESLLSGINKVFDEEKILWYQRFFTLPNDFLKDRILLNFGAVDQICEVFINGKSVGRHIGGYEAFSFDITDYIKDENVITLKVQDNLSNFILPYGKQRKDRGGMWYTSVSGIWQTVWLESVPQKYIKGLKINSDLDSATITFDGIESGIVQLDGKEYKIENSKVTLSPEVKEYWTPENPKLYNFTVCAGEDKIESYFALRTITLAEHKGKKCLCLNGRPYFFHGILDQGYWSDGLFTPASYECYEKDIKMLKSLGFNMLRKHIKIEPQLFYYACDRLGIAVFQDMVNNSDYSFLRDTALPTVHLLRRNDKRLHKNKESRAAFVNGMESTVKLLYSHPSIVEWTIFNEGWGQFCADEMYDKLKQLDSSRLIDSASGWFLQDKNDFESRHIYFRKLKAVKTDKPYFLSEFGGYAYAVEDHIFNPKRAFGYAICKTREDFVKRLRDLYLKEVIPLVKKGLCATVYTQVSDVEDEINGVTTFDRAKLKIKPEEFIDISEKLKNALWE